MQPFNNKKRPRSYENCGVFALYVSVCVEVVDRGLICEYKVAIAVIESAEIFRCAAVYSRYLPKSAADRSVIVYRIECRLRCTDVQKLIAHGA